MLASSNNGVKTIEGDIFEAFCQLGAVSEDNAVNPNKVCVRSSSSAEVQLAEASCTFATSRSGCSGLLGLTVGCTQRGIC